MGFVQPYAAQWLKENTTPGSFAHVGGHFALGAFNALANGGNGGDALLSGTAAGAAEIAIPQLAQRLYGTSDPDKLTAEQKANLKTAAALFGTAVGGAGGNAVNAANAGSAAENAVGNNFLGVYSQARYDESRKNIAAGRNAPEDNIDYAQLSEKDQISDYYLKKWRNGETLKEHQLLYLDEAIKNYYSENVEKYGIPWAMQDVYSLLYGTTPTMRPKNYDYPFAGTKEQKHEWEKANPHRIIQRPLVDKIDQGAFQEDLHNYYQARGGILRDAINDRDTYLGIGATVVAGSGTNLGKFVTGVLIGHGSSEAYKGKKEFEQGNKLDAFIHFGTAALEFTGAGVKTPLGSKLGNFNPFKKAIAKAKAAEAQERLATRYLSRDSGLEPPAQVISNDVPLAKGTTATGTNAGKTFRLEPQPQAAFPKAVAPESLPLSSNVGVYNPNTYGIPATSAHARVYLRENYAALAGIPRRIDQIWGSSIDDLARSFQMDGATVTLKAPRGSSSRKAKIYKVEGHPFVKEIQKHPGGATHGKGEYYKITYKDGVEVKIIDPDSGFNPLSIKEGKQFYYDNHGRPIDYDSVNKRWFRK